MRNIYVALNLKPEKGSCCNYESSYERIQTPTEHVFSFSEHKLLNFRNVTLSKIFGLFLMTLQYVWKGR